MLGMRGVRLGIMIPELTQMQVRAIFEAACLVAIEGVDVHPEVMIPLTSHVNELKRQREVLEAEAKKVMAEQGIDGRVQVRHHDRDPARGPHRRRDRRVRAVLLLRHQRPDPDHLRHLPRRRRDGLPDAYISAGILPENPFATIDPEGVGKLMRMAVERARRVKPNLVCGICGEHGGDPKSIMLCHKLGLDYVSCSPFRVPVARLAAAHAALKERVVKA